MPDESRSIRPMDRARQITIPRAEPRRGTETYYYTVNDHAGRQLGSAKRRSHRREPRAPNGRSERVYDIWPDRARRRVRAPGLRGQARSTRRTTCPTPTRGRTVRTFQYFPAPPAADRPAGRTAGGPAGPRGLHPDHRRGAVDPRADRDNARSFAAYKAYVDPSLPAPRPAARSGRTPTGGCGKHRGVPRAGARLRSSTPGAVIAAYLRRQVPAPVRDTSSSASRMP